MCNDYLGNIISDATTRCVIQSLTGNPADALQDYTIYLVALALTVVLVLALFSVLMLIAKVINKA